RARGPEPAAALRDREGEADPRPLQDGQVGSHPRDPQSAVGVEGAAAARRALAQAAFSVGSPLRQLTGQSAPVRRAWRTRSVSSGLRPTLWSVMLPCRTTPSGSMTNVARS